MAEGPNTASPAYAFEQRATDSTESGKEVPGTPTANANSAGANAFEKRAKMATEAAH